MALNNGFMTVVTIGEKKFEVDGYVSREILESFCSNRTIVTLNWTDNMKQTKPVLSESNFIVGKNGDLLEVEIVNIDDSEKRTFDTQATVAKAIEEFVSQLC